jgi:hypothetical protein
MITNGLVAEQRLFWVSLYDFASLREIAMCLAKAQIRQVNSLRIKNHILIKNKIPLCNKDITNHKLPTTIYQQPASSQ